MDETQEKLRKHTTPNSPSTKHIMMHICTNMEGNHKIAHNALKKLVILLVLLSSLDAIITPQKCPHSHSLCIYLSKIIQNPTINREYPHISRRKCNKFMKITNGNRNKPRAKKKDSHGIAIWNKASSHLQSSCSH